MNKKEMLEKKVWAVVGATNNKEKFGYTIWNKLQDNGYEVYPIIFPPIQIIFICITYYRPYFLL